MVKKMFKRNMAVVLLVVAGFAAYSVMVYAGNLEPSAAPGPTMKTLDEVEPRIPIGQADIPMTIATPGSYYLTEDVTATGIAITINVDDVTIDLMGFTIKGPGLSGISYGIFMDKRNNVEIRNGTVRDFRFGIIEVNAAGQNHRIIDVRVLSNNRYGIYLDGSRHLVKGCMASDNGTSATVDIYGIYTGSDSRVIGNTANNNGNSATSNVYGIYTGSGSRVTGNTANDNGNSATGNGNGILVIDGSIVTDNIVYNNRTHGIYAGRFGTITGNTVFDNQGNGIRAGSGSMITGNNAYSNQGYGIQTGVGNFSSGSTVTGNVVTSNQGYGLEVGFGSTVMGNTVLKNGSDGIQAGGGCTITENSVVSNEGNGIYANGRGCTVLGNTVRANNQANITDDAGIRVVADCLVKGNTVTDNNQNNIYVGSLGNAIEENLVTFSTGNGIYFAPVTGNFYANNRARSNSTANYGGNLPIGSGDGGGNAQF